MSEQNGADARNLILALQSLVRLQDFSDDIVALVPYYVEDPDGGRECVWDVVSISEIMHGVVDVVAGGVADPDAISNVMESAVLGRDVDVLAAVEEAYDVLDAEIDEDDEELEQT